MKPVSKQTTFQVVLIILLSITFISGCQLREPFTPQLTPHPTAISTATTLIKRESIAFLSSPDHNICFIRVDGSNKSCLDAKGTDDQPAWSPRGDQLVFYSSWGEIFGLYKIQKDSSNIEQLTHITELDRNPSWSPDGKQIAFSGNGIVYVMNADGTNVTRRTNVECLYPTWSPDGKYIVLAGTNTGLSNNDGCNFSGVYIMNADGSDKVLVTKLPKGEVYDVAWSPDGKTIIFTSNMDAPAKASWSYRDIYSINIDGFKVSRLTYDSGLKQTVSWSPDSKYIAFERYNSEENKWLIYIMNADGSNSRILTEGLYPAWQP